MTDYLKKIKINILGMNQKFESHANAIKQFELQFGQISMALNPHQQGSLQSNTIQNLKNDGHFLDITTRCGKTSTDPHIPVIVDDVVELVILNNKKIADLKKYWLIKMHMTRLKLMITKPRKKEKDNEVHPLLTPIP